MGLEGVQQKLVLIVEDEVTIAEAAAYALRAEGFDTVHVESGLQALAILERQQPNFLILDIGLPDISGFEVCKRIRLNSNLPILFLTARAEEIDRVLGFELGGDDYLTKPFSPRELASRVKAILRRLEQGRDQETTTAPLGDFQVDGDKLVISYLGKQLTLSRYEFRLLSVLIRRPGKVFSREQLMNLAWESPDMSLERTVDTHIKTIRAKLKEVCSSRDPIVTHRGFGYSLTGGGK